MPSYQDGFKTATLELMSGYPAYFYSAGDGNYICAMDDQYGLPIKLAGDASPDMYWLRGFNQGVLANIERYGLPWNSRLCSLDILTDVPGHFQREPSRCTRLKLGAKENGFDEFGFALSLEYGEMGRSVKLEAQSLFHDPNVVPNAMWPYRSGPPPPFMPSEKLPPSLRPGTKLVWLWVPDNTQFVECVPGPPNSHLVAFRFSGFLSKAWPEGKVKELFRVLDIQLAQWLPSGRFEPLILNALS